MAAFRVEKTRDFTVMSNHHLRNRTLSLKAKGLLSMMLSLPETWDYTTRGLAHICKEGVDSIGSTLSELETQGYLTRERICGADGRLGDVEYTIHEQPISQKKLAAKPSAPKRDFPDQVKPDVVKPDMAEPVTDFPAQLNIHNQARIKQNTNQASIHPINPAQGYPMDWMDEMLAIYRDLIKSNIEYDILSERYSHDRLDEVVELMLEVILSRRGTIRIAGDELPREVVKSRLLKIGPEHIEYVFSCLEQNTTKVRNIKAYILPSLYNAPATISAYYQAEVRHDLYGGGAV